MPMIAALAFASIVYTDVPLDVARVVVYHWRAGRPPEAIQASSVRDGPRMTLTLPASADTVVEFRRRDETYLLDGPMTVAPDAAGRRLDGVWRRTVRGAVAEDAVESAAIEWLPGEGADRDHWPVCWWPERGRWECTGVPLESSGVVVAIDRGRVLSAIVRGPASPFLQPSRWGRLVAVRDRVDGTPVRLKMTAARPVDPPQRSRALRVETARVADVRIGAVDASAMWIAGNSSPPSAWIEVRSARSGPAFVPLSDVAEGPPQVALQILLDETRALEVSVASNRGDPAPATLVTLFRLIDPPPGSNQERDRPPPRRVFAAEALADADGRVRLEGIGDAAYEIVAWHPRFGRGSSLLSPGTDRMTIRLQAPGIARGRVLVGGKPAAGVDVIAVPDPSAFAASADPIDLKGGDARTDREGQFSIALAPGGGGELRVGGGTRPVRRVPLPRVPLALVELGDIELGAPIVVNVTVDQDPGCDLRATGPIGRSGLQILAASRAGPGLFRLTLPEEGLWELGAVCGGDERPVTPAVVRITAGDRPQEVKLMIQFLSEGLRPSGSPTRALARRCAGSLRSRGSLAALVRIVSRCIRQSDIRHYLSEGLRPSDSATRALARRCAGSLRSRGSLAALVRIVSSCIRHSDT
jgi:hypothetical protein